MYRLAYYSHQHIRSLIKRLIMLHSPERLRELDIVGWLTFLKRGGNVPASRPRFARLWLETLEAREVPATLSWTGNGGTNFASNALNTTPTAAITTNSSSTGTWSSAAPSCWICPR